MRGEGHPLGDVAAEVDAGGDFGEGDAVGGEAEDGAFGDVEGFLAAAQRLAGGPGDLLDLGDELGDLPVAGDGEAAVPMASWVPLASKVPQKTTFLAFWAMSIKPPGPTGTPPSLETLTLPAASISPKPRKARSSPPPE